MKTFRVFLLITLVAATLVAICPAPASAADYWGGYWNWYDGTYVPYYQRSYSYYGPTTYGPAYSYGAPAYSYYGPAYSGYGYAPYGGTYYGGVPATGVGVYPGVAAARVGPLRLGWR
jgi:hypothetical protein